MSGAARAWLAAAVVSVVVVVAVAVEPEVCDLVLRHDPSFGLGVYAGRAFAAGDTLETAPMVNVPRAAVEGTVLFDYVEEVSLLGAE